MSARPESTVLAGGAGSYVTSVDGRRLLDLAMGFGSVFLGHAHPAVTASVQRQLAGAWNTSRLTTPAHARVNALLAALLPRGMRPAGLYSTGMETAEFAMRVAARHTGRSEFAGFARSMHGKSAMTASLAWANAPLHPATQHLLPFLPAVGESQALEELTKLLRTRSIAALFVEGVQGSNAAHRASDDFYRHALAACREHGTLCVFDEILTGLHRCGTTFFVDRLGVTPDVLLFAKSMGNGFPVSSVALAEHVQFSGDALPGSTFSGNPLATAAIEGTLNAMAALDMNGKVRAIEETVRSALAPVEAMGHALRGAGALWCVELAEQADPSQVQASVFEAGILIGLAGRTLRLLPAATLETSVLREACENVAEACRREKAA